MKRLLSFLLVLTFCIGIIMPITGVYADNGMERKEYLVQFNDDISVKNVNLVKAVGVNEKDILNTFDLLPVVHLRLTEKQAQALANNPRVKIIEEDAEAYALAQVVPWGVERVQARQAHVAGYTGNGIKVAVLDTGIDASHEDLNVRGGYSVFTDSANRNPFYDGNGHGTHVAGTIAALNNSVGVIGVAYNVDLYAVKVLNNSGSGSYSGIAQGIEWAVNNGMHVINMSLGGTSHSSILQNMCNAAYNAGVLLVAAAGNNGNSSGTGDNVTYPARYSSVMAVAATDQNNRRASFSSTGPAVEISAPGVNILSTIPNNRYASYNGTSMASPHVAGAAALVWAANRNLTNQQVRQILTSTAMYLGSSNHYGAGLVQAMDAINAAIQ